LDLTNVNPQEMNYLGNLLIVVFNPLQFATGSSDTVTISLFSRFINNSFKIPRLSTYSGSLFASPQSAQIQRLLKKPLAAVSSATSNMVGRIADKVLPQNVFTDILSSVLSFLDKPTDVRQQAIVGALCNRPNFQEGVELIDKLVVSPSQMYESTNVTFGTLFDEMDFFYLKKKFSYLGSFYVNTSMVSGVVVASFPITPIPENIIVPTQNQVTLLSYLSFPFSFWRGGITYRLEVIATSLQTCKMFVAFNFNTYNVPITLPVNVATSQYGEAFEINQGTNEIELTVPFVSSTPYKYVSTSNTYTSDNSTGYINIIVLNPLVAPSNTPITITVNVYMAGADDFELSTLSLSNNVLTAVPQSQEFVYTGSLYHLDISDEQEIVYHYSQYLQRFYAGEIFNFREAISFNDFVDKFVSCSSYQFKYCPRVRYFARVQSQETRVTPPLDVGETTVDLAADKLVAPVSAVAVRKPVIPISFSHVQQYLKKYQSIGNLAPLFSNLYNWNGWYFDIAAQFRQVNVDSSIVPTTYSFEKGLLSHFSRLYKQFKGPLRFKIMDYDPEWPMDTISVYFIPPLDPNPAIVGAGFPAVAPGFASSLDNTYGGLYPVASGDPWFGNMIKLPVHIYGGSTFRVGEFEIPFTSRFQSILLNTNFNGSIGQLGYIVVVNAPDYTSSSTSFRVMMSFGDETRLGTLYTVPYVIPQFTESPGFASVLPDDYPIVPPTNNTLVVL